MSFPTIYYRISITGYIILFCITNVSAQVTSNINIRTEKDYSPENSESYNQDISVNSGSAFISSHTYLVTDLGTLGGVESQARDINNRGEVVGWSLTASADKHAFLWLPAPSYGLPAGMNDLGTLSTGNESEAYAINNIGQVVGWSEIEDTNNPGSFIRRPFLWENGVMTNLGIPIKPVGGLNSWATTINDLGEVAGSWSGGGCCGSSAFLWLPEPAYGLPSGMTDLGGVQPAELTGVGQINALGQIAGGGTSDIPENSRAFLWLPAPAYGLPAGMNNLGTFDGVSSFGTSMNDQGQLVGHWKPQGEASQRHGFIWENGMMTDLGTLEESWSGTWDINRWGEIVGYNLRAVFPMVIYAILWKEGNIVDLNDVIPPDSGWELNWAMAINDVGKIVGYGTIEGETHAYLLRPLVPPIPTVSQWGLVSMTLMILISGTIILR